MTLQQLKYADAVATCGSLSEAARRVFVTQPTLTEAIRTLEEELRIAIFTRSSRGVALTHEGEEFLASARQILDDAALIQQKYTGKAVRRPQFAVSCQHFAFAVEAFMEVVRENDADSYDFTFRETVTSEIIDDVARHRSEIGMLYLSRRNERAIMKILRKEELAFEEHRYFDIRRWREAENIYKQPLKGMQITSNGVGETYTVANVLKTHYYL